LTEGSPQEFKQNASRAVDDAKLQRALLNVKRGFIVKRSLARSKLPEFGTLRDEARAIKDHTLNHLDLYLEAYGRKVAESGGHVHFAPSAGSPRHDEQRRPPADRKKWLVFSMRGGSLHERVVRAARHPPRFRAVVERLARRRVERREQALAFGSVVMLEQVLVRRVAVEKLEDATPHGARIPAETTGASDECVDHPADLLVLTRVEHEREAGERSETRVQREKHLLFVLHVQEEQLPVGAE